MTLNRLARTVAVVAFAYGSAALAAAPVLNCPAGTRQVTGEAGQTNKLMCMKPGAKRADGPYRELHANGKVQVEGQLKNGLRTGTWRIYTPEGALLQEIEFNEDSYNGKFVEFHGNGQKSREETFVMGKREGVSRSFDVNGKETRSVQFKADRPVSASR